MPKPLSALVICCLALCVTRAHAQPAADPARVHFDQGQALSASGDYATAYREFEAGYEASPRPAFLFNMGEAARAMGDPVKARAAYGRFLAVVSTGALANTARQRLAELGPAPVVLPPPRALAETIENREVLAGPTPPPAESRPLWKQWPLWAAVGGAVVAAVVIGVVATRHHEPGCGADCIDFR